jgi:hypothetical protein
MTIMDKIKENLSPEDLTQLEEAVKKLHQRLPYYNDFFKIIKDKSLIDKELAQLFSL